MSTNTADGDKCTKNGPARPLVQSTNESRLAIRSPLTVYITGTGGYLPQRIVSNAEVATEAGVGPEWIERKTGILSRRWAGDGVATSDLAISAANAALADAAIFAEEISILIVATSTPDYSQPPTAAIVQAGVAAVNATSFDINAVCSGFTFALSVAQQMLALSGGKALVIGADLYSRILNPRDRKTVILFGDGAGAAVIEASESPREESSHRIICTKLHSYGELYNLIKVPSSGSRLPFGTGVSEELRYFTMDGYAVREFVSGRLPALISDFLLSAGVNPEEIDHFVPHQANGIMVRDVFCHLGLNQARLHLMVDRVGNTGSASIPLMLDELSRSNFLLTGQKILLAGFGGGMSVGLCLVEW